jgi:hypothetical protein
VPVSAALIKALAPINKGLMNGGFLVKGLLVHSAKDGVTGNSIFFDFQSICGLYLSSQESPMIIGVEGVLIKVFFLHICGEAKLAT